jgi:hypothetical protein
MGQGCGFCGKLLRTFQQLPQPRQRRSDEIENSMTPRSGARGTRLGKLYLLDTGLLMGGTHALGCPHAHAHDCERGTHNMGYAGPGT